MSVREHGPEGGPMRDGVTRTGRAALLIVVALVVTVILLDHSPSTPAVTAAKTSNTTVPASHHPGGSAASSAPTTTTPTTTTPSTVPPAQVKVLVLNGASFSAPLASDYTLQVKNDGYDTLAPNNAASTVPSSVIYVMTKGFTPEADTLAAKLGLTASAVQTTVPTGPPLSASVTASGANLVLVVGPDLAARS